MSVEGYLHSFALDLAELVLRVLLLVFLVDYLESIAEVVVFIFEKIVKNDVLIFLQDSVLAFDEG